MLSHEDAKAFYDRFGARQDRQSFYEDRASADLIAHGAFDEARRVVEFGCGTGRLAERLLVHHLPADAAYLGLDVSTTMVDLAARRLARWRGRAAAQQISGAMALEAADRSCDRFVAAYVLDLLNDGDCRDLIAEARRILVPDGRLCLAGLTHGVTKVSRLVSRAWTRVHAVNPKLLGGCRPRDLRACLPAEHWQVRHRRVLTNFAIPSEVVIATPRAGPSDVSRG